MYYCNDKRNSMHVVKLLSTFKTIDASTSTLEHGKIYAIVAHDFYLFFFSSEKNTKIIGIYYNKLDISFDVI